MPVSFVDAIECILWLVVDEVVFRMNNRKSAVDTVVYRFTVVRAGYPTGDILHEVVLFVTVLSQLP
jgi:hypothetical protein